MWLLIDLERIIKALFLHGIFDTDFSMDWIVLGTVFLVLNALLGLVLGTSFKCIARKVTSKNLTIRHVTDWLIICFKIYNFITLKLTWRDRQYLTFTALKFK